ncbi:hypothetical protein BV25DRAFT_1438807 [Artomyces pyxidatus]|uniref:Uncharacterized protein n=1 Tax=Artomyces pyxidatus TaxID=48021 RepID=A0ACB8SL10_9AGAM|nr:hypothetical protein BV25DRAFT_1438807 [Artomyces pyxidatus]
MVLRLWHFLGLVAICFLFPFFTFRLCELYTFHGQHDSHDAQSSLYLFIACYLLSRLTHHVLLIRLLILLRMTDTLSNIAALADRSLRIMSVP